MSSEQVKPRTLNANDGAVRVSGVSSGNNADNFDDVASPPAVLSHHQREQAQLAELFERFALRNWIFLFLLGLINNFHYNLVIAGANTLASSYGMKSLVALISFTNVFFGIIARIVNAFVANRVSYNVRMTLMSCGTLVGLFFVSLSGPFGRGNNVSSFVVLLVGVAFTGTSYCYGESVALTFVQRYPPKTVGAWGSGTGTSGVIASLLFLFLTNAGLTERTIFLISMPLALCYWLVFNFGLVAPHKVVVVTERNTAGETVTERVIIHNGHEDKVTRALHERVALGGGTLSDPEYEMIINFRGLCWKSIPPPPSEKVAVEEEEENAHFELHRRQSTLSGAATESGQRVAKRGDDRSVEEALMPVTPSSKKTSSRGVGAGTVEPCRTPTTSTSADDDDARRTVEALAALTEEVTRTHGDDLHYACCRPLCGCYPRDCSLRRWWRQHGHIIGLMHNAMLWYMFNLAVVYITEYAAQFMAPFSFYCRPDWKDNFWIKNSYTITQFCYQFGVFISRSSLTFGLRIPFVGVLSIIQLCNAVLWFVQAKVMFIASRTSEGKEVGLAFLLFVWMLFVGLVGGASYVNVFYLILCKGRKMQEADERVKSVFYLRALRGEDITEATNPPRAQADHGGASASVPGGAVSVSQVPVSTGATVTHATSHPHPREEQESAFSLYSPAEGREMDGNEDVVDPEELVLSLSAMMPEKKKKSGGNTVEGQPLPSGSESSDDENEAVTLADVDRDPRQASLLAPYDDNDAHRNQRGTGKADGGAARTTHKSTGSSSTKKALSDGPLSSSALNQHEETGSSGDTADATQSQTRPRSKAGFFRRLWSFRDRHRSRAGDVEDDESVSDFKPLTTQEEATLEELSIALAGEWQARRELAMAIGSLYAMVGICIGTTLDVIFTNTVLKDTVTCS